MTDAPSVERVATRRQVQPASPGGRSTLHDVPELLFRQYDDAARVRLLVRLAQPCGARAERAVEEHLHAANAQPFIAEAAAQAQANGVVQAIEAEMLQHAQAQLAAPL